MGTNYYLYYNFCHCCGQARKIVHLGKSSIGWRFIFYKHDFVKNFEDFKNFIKQGTIKNEYGEILSEEELLKLIKLKQTDEIDPDCEIIDDYVFSDQDFS